MRTFCAIGADISLDGLLVQYRYQPQFYEFVDKSVDTFPTYHFAHLRTFDTLSISNLSE